MGMAEKEQIAYDILAYLNEHPNAQDTLEGISEWWILEQRIRRDTARVEEALSELLVKELVIGHKGKDSRTRYGINQHKRAEIRALLQKISKKDC